MSQRPIRDNSKAKNPYNHYDTQKFKYGQNSSNMRYRRPYSKDFQYYSAKYNFQPWWGRRRRKPPERESRKRSPSPLSGTEEYTLRKIQKASDMIKKRLLMPPESDNVMKETETTPTPVEENHTEINPSNKSNPKSDSERSSGRSNKKAAHYNVGEIHEKIISHITNLSHGKKMNLICANSSGYDIAIQRIQKQKRLELSKALRDMCSNQSTENTEVINSIMPDIGVKIEDLPLEVIQELSYTLDLNFDENYVLHNSEQTKTVNNEVCENDSDVIYIEPGNVKQEVIEIIDDDIKSEVIEIKGESFEENTPDLNIGVDGNSINVENEIIEIKEETFDKDAPDSNIDGGNSIQIGPIKNEIIEIKEETSDENTPDFNVGSNSTDVQMEPPMEVDYCHKIKIDTFTDAITDSDLPHRVDVCLQTEYQTCSATTQTCFKVEPLFEVEAKNVENLDEAVRIMFEMDKEIDRITKLRQTMFTKIQNKNLNISKQRTPQNRKTMNKTIVSKKQDILSKKQQKVKNGVKISHELNMLNDIATNSFEGHCRGTLLNKKNTLYVAPLDFGRISEKILVIQLVHCQDILLAGTETGKVYSINSTNGQTSHIFAVTTVPITALCYWRTSRKRLHILVGSADNDIREYAYNTKEFVKTTNVGEGVQCLEVAWNHVFIGTVNGHLKRYSIKLNKIQFEEKISKSSVLVLKATVEGSRRVLLVGSRNAPVCVRDAMSGLHLRTMNDFITPTVYSLVLDKSLVCCGTTFHDILVFRFQDGRLIHKHQAANSKGISCMKVVENLLYASCYNGNIYVYSTRTHEFVGTIDGPGGVILSMEVLKNIVIVGTLSCKFESILIPENILEHNNV